MRASRSFFFSTLKSTLLLQALFSLRVCDPVMLATHNDTRIIHALNVKIQKDRRVEMCFLPMADGVNIAMKL